MVKYFKGQNFKSVALFALVSPIALLIILSILIINLFRPVYVVGLSNKGRITPYMRVMELHLRNANRCGRNYVMIFVCPGLTPNNAARDLYCRQSIIIDSRYPTFIRKSFAITVEVLQFRFTPKLPLLRILWNCDPATTLTPHEIQFKNDLLNQLGIPRDAEFVCLGVKESSYYASITKENGYGQDLSHQAEDSRNVEISNYLDAANFLANQGIYVVRVGSVVNSPLPSDRHPMIKDYATTHRSELGDVVLGANCKFSIIGSSGFWIFAAAFNKPMVICDVYEWGYVNDLRDLAKMALFSLRLLRNRDNVLVPFKEIAFGGSKLSDDRFLTQLNFEPIPNSPDEITQSVIEMNKWLDETLEFSEEDKYLQSKFQANYPAHSLLPENESIRISPSFLRKYRSLL